jgi:catechol 2,3-dioxygenase-like lactoylglutathione lyase family enzyme
MIKSINHIGISVQDMDRSLAFYRDILGMEVLNAAEYDDQPVVDTILGLKNARVKVVMVGMGGVRFELFEFSHPKPKDHQPQQPVCEYGISHFCLQVDDLHQEYERLLAAGVSFHCPPQELGKPGAYGTYARDPDGNVFELIELPDGLDIAD